jgi:hypothetical protein
MRAISKNEWRVIFHSVRCIAFGKPFTGRMSLDTRWLLLKILGKGLVNIAFDRPFFHYFTRRTWTWPRK